MRTLLFIGLLSSLFLVQACEVIYKSSIVISRDEYAATDAGKHTKEGYFAKLFTEYCSHKRFQLQEPKEISGGQMPPREVQTLNMQCSGQWFYYASLWNREHEYEIELSLMQPWSPWLTNKQKRFFCSETKDLFDFFKVGLAQANATYKPHSSCR
jgi:hypothetical protein